MFIYHMAPIALNPQDALKQALNIFLFIPCFSGLQESWFVVSAINDSLAVR